MLIKKIIKSIIIPFVDLYVSIKMNDIFLQKEWLRKNKTQRLNFYDNLLYSLIEISYNKKMIKAGGMIGIGANLLTPPHFTSWTTGSIYFIKE